MDPLLQRKMPAHHSDWKEAQPGSQNRKDSHLRAKLSKVAAESFFLDMVPGKVLCTMYSISLRDYVYA